MAKKISQSLNYLYVLDTVTGKLISGGKSSFEFIKQDNVTNVYTLLRNGQAVDTIVLGDAITQNDIAFTETSLKSFIELNTGFSQASGSGASGNLTQGWASYEDGQYTLSSPFVIAQGVTSTIPNNASIIKNTFLPLGLVDLYNPLTSKVTPEFLGDYYVGTFRFKAKNSAAFGLFETSIELGGVSGIQFPETQNMSNTALVEQTYGIVIPFYVGSDFLANGGIPKIRSVAGTTSIYDIEYQFARINKGT
jgi:hypothetical protein